MATHNHYLFECTKPNCYRRLTFWTLEEVEHERVSHPCPYWGGKSKVSWSVTKTLVQQMWDLLDRELDEIKGHWADNAPNERGWVAPSLVDPEYHKTRARALAECIAIFMPPFFTTADQVVREALKRWEARRDSDTEYETAGLGIRRYETSVMAAKQHESAAPGWYGTAQDGYTADPTRAGSPSPNRGRGVATRAAVTIPEKDATAMKMAYEGMPQIFTPKVLATQYKYPESAVRKLLGLDTP